MSYLLGDTPKPSNCPVLWKSILLEVPGLNVVQEMPAMQPQRDTVLPRQEAGEADKSKKGFLFVEERRLQLDRGAVQTN